MKSSREKLLAAAAALAFIAGIGTASAQSVQQHEGKNNSPAPQSSQPQTQKEPESRSQDAAPKQSEAQPNEKSAPNAGPTRVDATTPEKKKAQQQGQRDRDGATQQRQGQSQDVKKQNGQAQSNESGKKSGRAASSEINPEQRTKISQTIRQQKVQRVTNVDFNITIGTRVPRSHRFYPLPATIYSFVPAYRGYLYVMVGDQILIVHPRTHEIVAVIDA